MTIKIIKNELMLQKEILELINSYPLDYKLVGFFAKNKTSEALLAGAINKIFEPADLVEIGILIEKIFKLIDECYYQFSLAKDICEKLLSCFAAENVNEAKFSLTKIVPRGGMIYPTRKEILENLITLIKNEKVICEIEMQSVQEL